MTGWSYRLQQPQRLGFHRQIITEVRVWIKKPLFSREGANVSIIEGGIENRLSDGPYGEEGYIVQAFEPLPVFEGNHTLIGSWLVDDMPAGISVREDASAITQDLSRYLPHIIL